MISIRLAACTLVAMVAGADTGRAQAVEPVKVDAGHGPETFLNSKDVQKDGAFSIAELGASEDGRFKSGIFKSDAGEIDFDAYPEDEFCYFISGDTVLTSASGKVTTFKAGEAVFVPKGWKGRWSTTGFSKFYAAYTPSQPERPTPP